MTLYRVNGTFEGGVIGEIVEADPALVADWIEDGWVSEVDERGDRIVPGGKSGPTDPGGPRTVDSA